MIDSLIAAFPALGGAGAMLLVARFVWSMSVEELDRLRTRVNEVEKERDYFAEEAAVYRRALVHNAIQIPKIKNGDSGTPVLPT